MNSTFPKGEVFTPTDTVVGQFNTFDPATGLLITLAGSPSLRLERFRAGAWEEITGDGITLDEDADHDSAGARTGRHSGAFDLDDANIAAQSGDRYDILLHAGTVDGDSMAHVLLGWFYTQTDGLTTAQKADVNAEADTALTDYDAATGTELAAVDAKIDTIDGEVGTIDTVVDAVKAKTDQITFSAAGFADVNVMEINDNGGLTGDGDGTPVGKA
jgi:hypothetical protein